MSLQIQAKIISEATAADIYCFLGSHGANYIPTITAKDKRLRDVAETNGSFWPS